MKTIFQVYATLQPDIAYDKRKLEEIAMDIAINAGKVEIALITDANKVKWHLRPLMLDLITAYRRAEAPEQKDNFFNDYKTKDIQVSEDYAKTISYPVSLVIANIKRYVNDTENKEIAMELKLSIMSLFKHLNAGVEVTGMPLAILLEGPKDE